MEYLPPGEYQIRIIKDANGNTVDFEYARNKDGEIVYTSAKGMIVKDGKIDKSAYRRLGQILLRNPDRITEHTKAVDSIKAEQLKAGKIKTTNARKIGYKLSANE